MWLYRINTGPLGRVLRLYWRLCLEGAVDEIPRDGPLLVVANHSSFLDPWYIAMCFPRCIRYLTDWKWYYRNRFYEALFRAYGTLPVHPREAGRTIDEVCASLAHGDVVGIFPEGGISHDGRVARFRSGVVRIAARSGAPIVPLGIRGGFESLPRTTRIPRPSRISVHAGPPMVFPGSPRDHRPPMSEIHAFLAALRDEVLRLAGREEGGE